MKQTKNFYIARKDSPIIAEKPKSPVYPNDHLKQEKAEKDWADQLKEKILERYGYNK